MVRYKGKGNGDNMKKLIYPACFYPCQDKKGAYTVTVPDLPGCVTEGATLGAGHRDGDGCRLRLGVG